MMRFDDDFKGKVVFVTGGVGGIGKGICSGFAREGAKIAVADIDEEKAVAVVEAVKELGAESIFVKVDVTSEESVLSGIDITIKTFGGLDILVNGAGTAAVNEGPPSTVPLESDWDICYNVNVKGTLFTCKAVYELFKNQQHGKIVNIASMAGKTGSPALPHYSATKAAVINYTQTLARELAPYNINVNAVCPGLVWTPLWERGARILTKLFVKVKPDITPEEVFASEVNKLIPMKRPQTAQDVANAVLFLASEAACNITAQAINVDGGGELR